MHAGSNDTEECLYTRHRRKSPTCTGCGEAEGDVVHNIEDFPVHESDRDRIKYEIVKHSGEIRLKLSKIVLYSEEFEV